MARGRAESTAVCLGDVVSSSAQSASVVGHDDDPGVLRHVRLSSESITSPDCPITSRWCRRGRPLGQHAVEVSGCLAYTTARTGRAPVLSLDCVWPISERSVSHSSRLRAARLGLVGAASDHFLRREQGQRWRVNRNQGHEAPACSPP